MCRVESFLYGKEFFGKLICGFEGRFYVIFAQKDELSIFDKKLVYGPNVGFMSFLLKK